MFESLGVMTQKELEARNEVKWETYTKKIQIEARVLGDLSMNHIIPVATHYQSQLLKNVENMAEVFNVDKAEKLSARNVKIIEEIARAWRPSRQGVEELVEARKLANKIDHRAREGHCLPRHGGPEDGGDSLSHRQTGTHRGRRTVDSAQIPRTAVYQVAGSDESKKVVH